MSSDESYPFPRGGGTGYQVLLIDLDGTVVDYVRTEAAALAAVHREFFSGRAGYPEFAAAFHACNAELWAAYRRGELSLDDLRTERFARVIRRLKAKAGAPGEVRRPAWPAPPGAVARPAWPVPPGAVARAARPALSAVVARFEAELGRRVALFPEARPALRALRRLARLVLVTDGIAAVQHAKLSRTRLRRFFDRVVISSEVGYRKPQPALLRRALDLPGAARQAALVVGDSTASDGAGAHAAGLDFCWVNRTGQPQPSGGQVPARFQVRDLQALVMLLASPARGD